MILQIKKLLRIFSQKLAKKKHIKIFISKNGFLAKIIVWINKLIEFCFTEEREIAT
jgi:hypothetical protein